MQLTDLERRLQECMFEPDAQRRAELRRTLGLSPEEYARAADSLNAKMARHNDTVCDGPLAVRYRVELAKSA